VSTHLALAVPADVTRVIDTLIGAGHEAFIVGGCVRDALRGVDPRDWDVATSAQYFESKFTGPDGQTVDISEHGWLGAANVEKAEPVGAH